MFEKLIRNDLKRVRLDDAPPRARKGRKVKPQAETPRGGGLVSRMYHAARASRLTSGWATSTTSADSELMTSLTQLRNRSRALVRDAAYAKRARVIVQTNVIGSGIGLQAQVMSSRDMLRENVNDEIEDAFKNWSRAEYCHTGGSLHFRDLERALMGQVFEAGEVFVRKHYRAFGGSPIPFTLELVEAERVADEFVNPSGPMAVAPGSVVKMGIEQDRYGRPLAYWIRSRHPGEYRALPNETDMIERVPADQVIHLRLIDRWPQTRGEPWLHAAARKLNDMDGYSEAEIVAARGGSTYMGAIENPEGEPDPAEKQEDGSYELPLEPGVLKVLKNGQKIVFHSPNRPNTALDPFMRYMLREIAAGTGPSYESLSRDYSQSNFSASQIAVHEDRDLWRTLQQWFIRAFRYPLHQEWLRQAVLSRAVSLIGVEEYALASDKYEACAFKPRGWGWVQPRTDVPAMIAAVKAGFMPLGDVIAATCNGKDFWDVMNERKRELEILKELGLVFETSPETYVKAEPAPAAPEPGDKDDDPPDPDDDDEQDENNDPRARVVPFQARAT